MEFEKHPETEQQHVNQEILKKLDEALEKLNILLDKKQNPVEDKRD